jgi:Kef-type K+ transport system membrane component KefB
MTEMFNNDRDQQAAAPPSASKGWARRMVLPVFYVLMTVGAVAAFLTMGLTILFIVGILVLLRPMLKRVVPLLESSGRVSEGSIALIFIAVLVSALMTEYIGVHAIFEAFLLGSVIPHDSRVASEVTHRLEHIVKVMLLPVFFTYTGMARSSGCSAPPETGCFAGS